MDFQNINVIEIVRIVDVELYQTKLDKATLLDRGTLSLLYSQEHNWYILKINGWNYGLNKDIPLLASTREKDALRAYVLANVDGYYVIKITDAPSSDIERLDNIVKRNSQFAYKEEAGGHGLPISLEHGTVKIKRIASEGDILHHQPLNMAHLVYKGGKTVRKSMVNTAEVISVGLVKFGDYLQENVISKPKEETKVNPKTVKRMNFANNVTGMIAPIGSFYIKGIMSLTKRIAQKIETKFEKKAYEKEVVHIQEEHEKNLTKNIARDDYEFTGGLTHAAIHAGINIWHAMAESLDIISDGFSTASTNVVSHKYGPAVGQVFKMGVGIAGTVGIPGSKYLKMLPKSR